MALQFKPAVRHMAKLRMALVGVAGSGKTLSALFIAKGLGGRIALVDTEANSSTKYAGDPDVPPFDVLTLESFHPQRYIDAIDAAEQAGYNILILDGISPAWTGKDGILELVETARMKSKTGNTFSDGWKVASPIHQKFTDRILQSSLDILATIRSKQEYVLEERDGKKVPVKKGMEIVQRNDMDYLFDLVGDLNIDHVMIITKSRCRALSDQVIPLPGSELGQELRAWLTDGAPMPEPSTTPTPAPQRTNGLPPAPQSQGATKRAPESQPGHPTRTQLTRLFTLKGEHRVSDDSLKLKLMQYGVESTKDLSLDQYQAVCDWIESPAPAIAPEEDVPDGLVPGSEAAWNALEERSRQVGWTSLQWQGAREHLGYADVLAEIVALEPDPTQRELI